jgi:endogenous inhibitor of DNA gyrase (YacG/DUF329 family)
MSELTPEQRRSYAIWAAKQRRKRQTGTCAICGKSFDRLVANQPVLYCSNACKVKAYQRRKAAKRQTKQESQLEPVVTAPIRKAPPPPEWKDSDLYATKPASPEVLAAIARSAQDMRDGKHKPFDGARRAPADLTTPPQPQEPPDA